MEEGIDFDLILDCMWDELFLSMKQRLVSHLFRFQ